MDYETKLYLDKLIETIEKPDGPDWWMIVLTVINIVAFVFVAWTQIKIQKHQTKLQEQQTKQQDYEIYKLIYDCICGINIYADILIYKVYLYASSTDRLDVLKNNINQLYKELDSLHIQLDMCSCDIEIKCSKPSEIIKDYYGIINEARSILVELLKITIGERIRPQYDESRLDCEETESIINIIVERCDTTTSQQVDNMLSRYSKFVQSVVEKNYLQEIRKLFR